MSASAVLTPEWAEEALREWRLAGSRMLTFCVSVRHAHFMAHVFREARVPAVAVHSGPTSTLGLSALRSAWTCSTQIDAVLVVVAHAVISTEARSRRLLTSRMGSAENLVALRRSINR